MSVKANSGVSCLLDAHAIKTNARYMVRQFSQLKKTYLPSSLFMVKFERRVEKERIDRPTRSMVLLALASNNVFWKATVCKPIV